MEDDGTYLLEFLYGLGEIHLFKSLSNSAWQIIMQINVEAFLSFP